MTDPLDTITTTDESTTTERASEVLRFLEALFYITQEGLVEIRHTDGRQEWFAMDHLDEAAEYVSQHPVNACVGVGVRNTRGGTINDVLGFTGVWVDLDRDPDAYSRFSLLPSIVVASGHGTHAYYLTDSLITDLQQVTLFNKALVAALNGDPNAVDAARILRVPGTINAKKDMAPVPVCLESADPGRRYYLDDIRDAITFGIISNHWNQDLRHNLALSLGGYLAHRGVAEDNAISLVEHLVEINADPEGRDRVRAVSDSYARFVRNQPVKGYTGLFEILTDEEMEALDGIWGKSKGVDVEGNIAHLENLPEDERYAGIVDFVPMVAYLPVPEQLKVRNDLKRRLKFPVTDFDQVIAEARGAIDSEVSKGIISDPREQDSEDTAIEREIAIEFGKTPNLLDETYADLRRLGLVDEERNAKQSYLSYTSRKLPMPINQEVRGGTGTGKNFLTDKVAQLMPPEDLMSMSRITPRFIDYLPEDALYRKILMIRERAGADGADYSLRIITDDTNPDVSLGYVGKDEHGNNVAMERHLRGPVVLVETTTKLQGDPENESRLFVHYVDESEAHRERVHDKIKENALPHKKLSDEERRSIIRRHHALQRNLEAIDIAIPFASLIKFPTRRTRSSRDLKRFLACVEASTLLNQYQRRRVQIHGKEYLIAVIEDYRAAYDLLADTLRQIQSELNPQSRKLLEAAYAVVERKRTAGGEANVHFKRIEVGKELGWERYQVQRAIEPLDTGGWVEVVDSEGKAFHYRLLWEPGKDDEIELLTPGELEADIAAHIDEIDPIYVGGKEHVATVADVAGA